MNLKIYTLNTFVTFIFVVCVTFSLFAEMKMNPFTGKMEYTDKYNNLLETQEALISLPTQVHLKNDTDETIWTALSYLDVNTQWQTEGWWKLKPGEEAFVVRTHNKYFYVYAYSEDSNSTWGGSDFYNYIRDSKEIFGFVQCEIIQKVRKFTQSFTKIAE